MAATKKKQKYKSCLSISLPYFDSVLNYKEEEKQLSNYPWNEADNAVNILYKQKSPN